MNRSTEFVVSEESIRCAAVIPSKRCVSSRDIGWTSLLVDHHIGCRSSDPYRPSPTSDFIIGVATSGRYASEALRGGKWHRGIFETGSICLPCNEETRELRFDPFSGHESSTALIYLPYSQLADAAEHMRPAGKSATKLDFDPASGRDPAIFHVVTSLLRAIELKADHLYAQSAAAWLAFHLVGFHLQSRRVDEMLNQPTLSDVRLAGVIEYMTVHFAQPLSLDELASAACISKYHFVRVFRAKVGQTPHSFLTNLRLQAAQRMLIGGDLSIAEISAACGYPGPAHFSTAFARKYRMSPTAFRASQRK